MSAYTRLGLTFDTTKFGNDINADKKTLVQMKRSIGLTNAQISIFNAGTQNDTAYFTNPANTQITSLHSQLTNLVISCKTKNFTYASANAKILANTCNNTIITLDKFLSHTNNLSGVSTSSNIAFPDRQTATDVGKKVQQIIYHTDGIVDNRSSLGCFTSLYVNTDLTTYSSSVQSMNNNISISSTNAYMISCTSDVNTINTFLTTAMNNDISYFANCITLLNDFKQYKKNINGFS